MREDHALLYCVDSCGPNATVSIYSEAFSKYLARNQTPSPFANFNRPQELASNFLCIL